MIDLNAVSTIGRDLQRPECVLATKSGDLYVSHKGHGVARICPNGDQYLLAPSTQYQEQSILPNGIALKENGSFIIANISDAGGIFELDPDGMRPLVTEIGGQKMPPVNFVKVDEVGRVWFSVSSTFSPRHLAYRRGVRNGFVGIIENGKAKILLDGLHYTNEIKPDLKNGWLYVSETFGQFISRFAIRKDGTLGAREVYAQFPRGAFVDGIALDDDGGVWAACIVSNELYHVPKGGIPKVYVQERNQDWVDEVEDALDAKKMNRSHFDKSPAIKLQNIASVAFHGESLDKLVCGCLLGEKLVSMKAPVKGRPPVHWEVEVPLWGEKF
ncbi:MAG: SMP-30/gluconolactonase/LRE family protein [Hyphomicrobiales bacterium]